jgi:hypothetical protein
MFDLYSELRFRVCGLLRARLVLETREYQKGIRRLEVLLLTEKDPTNRKACEYVLMKLRMRVIKLAIRRYRIRIKLGKMRGKKKASV